MDLSFSGAGFMGCYYFGVVDCFNKYIPRDRVNRVAGASAGSLIAAYYLMDLPLKSCLREIIAMTEDIRSRPLGVFDRSNQVVDVLPKILDRLFPEDAHKQVSGRLHVCMTRLKGMKKIIVNEFESKKDLIDALNCSCFIPVWSGNHVSTFRGVKHIDGGFSDNLPVFDEHTIRICCFSGKSDISPYDRVKSDLLSSTVLNTPLYFNFANFRRGRKALFPPPASFILDILERGFHDAKQFILTNDLIQCQACYEKSCGGQFGGGSTPVARLHCPTISPAATPQLSRRNSLENRKLALQLSGSSDSTTTSSDSYNSCSSSDERLAGPGSQGSGSFLELPGPTASGRQQHKRSGSFSRLLSEKLQRSATQLNLRQTEEEAEEAEVEDANNNLNRTSTPKAPVVIVVSSEESEQKQQSGRQDPRFRRKESAPLNAAGKIPSASRLKLRRNTVAFGQEPLNEDSPSAANSLLVVRDKFTLAPHPLPSCPPSPNLNRHCTECIRLRQEARMDLLEEAIRQEAAKFHTPGPIRENTIKSKLTSPIRWFRQLGVKNSYRFEDESVATVLAQ